MKVMERLAKARLFLVSKPRHINSTFTVNTPILYISSHFHSSENSGIFVY